MTESLEDIVEEAIDRVIRSFSPDDHDTFGDCDSELQRVEALLSSSEPEPDVLALLARIHACRISLAAEIGDAGAIVRQSEYFLKTYPPAGLDSANVRAWRLRALHVLGRHSDELRETLEAAKMPEVLGEDFVLLLEGLAKRHPGSLASEALLQKKMRDVLKQLGLAGYANLPAGDEVNADLERVALATAAEFRRVNEVRTNAILAENGS